MSTSKQPSNEEIAVPPHTPDAAGVPALVPPPYRGRAPSQPSATMVPGADARPGRGYAEGFPPAAPAPIRSPDPAIENTPSPGGPKYQGNIGDAPKYQSNTQ